MTPSSSRSSTPALALPVAVALPFIFALMLHSYHLRGSGIFRVLFFLPYVVPFVAGVLIWGGMLNPDTGWLNWLPQGDRDRAPARLARRSGLDLLRAW